MTNVDISIIIVSWNVKSLLRNCLSSIYQNRGQLNIEIIVVDNASKDGTAKEVAEEFPEVILIANQTNFGFGSANNQGMMKSRGRYILLLNPDTLILPQNFELVINKIAANPKIGILGCQTLNPDRTIQPSIRRFPTFWPIFLILTKISKLAPNLKTLNYYFATDIDYGINQPVDQVQGAYMLIRRELIDEIGMFDENFFNWFEEVDLCRRAIKAGWQVYYSPEPKIIHYGGQSFKQELTIKKQVVFFRSAWYYFQKNGLK